MSQDLNQSHTRALDNLQETGTNVVYALASVFTRSLEIILRPWHSTRYFSIVTTFASSALMLLLPLLAALAEGLRNMIPFAGHSAPDIGFDIGSFAKLYFILSAVHAFRLYKRLTRPETELHSRFEGPPLPFFFLLPGSKSFFFVRIVLEPGAVFIATTILANFRIITPGLSIFLHLSALCLVVKEFIDWQQSWIRIRDLLDSRNAGPLIAKLMDNTATEAELAPIHLASFPRNLSDELRKETIVQIARAYNVRTPKTAS